MVPYNFLKKFQTDLHGWFKERFLYPILDIEGGWEYWVQIDFPAYIDVSHNCQYNFRREISYNGIRVDWLINGETRNPIAVELKCQTHKYLNRNFLSDVQKDIESLKQWPHDYHKVSIAATVDPHVAEALKRENFIPLLLTEKVHFYSLILGN